MPTAQALELTIKEMINNSQEIVPPIPYPRPAKRTSIKNHTTALTLSTFDSKTFQKRERKKTCTELLCELTRLRTQQKYLECNQVKLKSENFQEKAKNETTSSASSSSPLVTPSKSAAAKSTTPAQLISEIEQLKIELNSKLCDFRSAAKHEVLDLRLLVDSLRDDVTHEERLRLFSLPAIRERIIDINKHLEYLRTKNNGQLEKLQKDCMTFERDVKVRLKQ